MGRQVGRSGVKYRYRLNIDWPLCVCCNMNERWVGMSADRQGCKQIYGKPMYVSTE